MYKTNMLIALFTCLAFYFSGCIADRDFTPGVSVLDNIVEAIHSSNKVILVLTDHGQMLRFNRYFTFFQNHWDDTATIAILILNVV
jgi:hypothetical protein